MAFIYKDTKELRKNLEYIGYVYCPTYSSKNGTCLCVAANTGHYFILQESAFCGHCNWKDDARRSDCGTNEELFLKIAKEKFDNQYYQNVRKHLSENSNSSYSYDSSESD